jgi:hypothetical protein
MKIYVNKIAIIILFLVSLFNVSNAQTFEMERIPTDQFQLGLKYLHANFNDEYEQTIFSGTYELFFNIPVSSDWNILGRLPFIATNLKWKPDQESFNYENDGLGNIYIGMQKDLGMPDYKKSILSFGFFLPTADEDAAGFGEFTDFVNFQQYFSNTLTLQIKYAFHYRDVSGMRFGVEIGPRFMVPTQANDYNDPELYINYGFSPGTQVYKILIRTEILGVFMLTENADNFEDRFIHSVNFGAAWTGEPVKPKLFYKIYLKDFIRDVVDGVLGLEVSVSVN